MTHHRLLAAFVIVLALGSTAAGQGRSAEEEHIRALVQTFADARNAHDGAAVAVLYTEDGQWISNSGSLTVSGRPALARLWGRLSGHVRRTFDSVDFVAGNLAVVRVVTHYAEPLGRHGETFVFVKDQGRWSIRVHQSID